MVVALAFLPNGDLVTGSEDGYVRLWQWRRRTDAPVRVLNHGRPVRSLAVDRSGRWVAAAGIAPDAHVWDLQKPVDAAPVLLAHDFAVFSVAFDPSGNFLATASSDGTANVWEGWDTGAPRDIARVTVTSGAAFVAFSHDGRLLASLTNGAQPFVSVTPWRQAEMIAAGRAALAAGERLDSATP